MCERLAAAQGQQDRLQKQLDFLSFVVANLKANEDLQMRLTSKFLGLDQSFIHNTQLTLILMRRGIISP